eukprot:3184094-Alexandrium_andersonii.AAC.1
MPAPTQHAQALRSGLVPPESLPSRRGGLTHKRWLPRAAQAHTRSSPLSRLCSLGALPRELQVARKGDCPEQHTQAQH